MMSTAFKFILWSICINSAVGILAFALPIFNENGFTNGVTYNPTMLNDFNTRSNGSISPQGNMVDAGNSLYRLLDKINLGFIGSFIDLFKNFMWGGIDVIQGIVSSIMGSAFALNGIFNILRGLMVLLYFYAIFTLWTGRDVN